ncbi:hypothetical protein LTR17_025911 [Elasticomyces elasticus]|nr:hypothetical protein LTR17_025911 [Elasticomyces elasticus]
MSTGPSSRQRSTSSASRTSKSNSNSNKRIQPPAQTLTPDNPDQAFQPCAATASFLLYAQRNVILVLHHDTLAIERRFTLHLEDVVWVQVDNTSERGSGRLAVSYDAGNTVIVWDILTGGEVARFSSYEHMRIASFLRNGNIAFGNDQGNVILFEPSTAEHISARTIFDPVTALAPSFDCRTFAIGYMNGSILVATLQPSFTILHTLTTNRAPSRITGLSWHGSSSKQKTDMLATQTSDGDLRVWSVPKIPHQDLQPTIIRVLQRAEIAMPSTSWFAWSKNGRIVQYTDGETRAWDVRTKRVTFEVIPTADGVCAMANYGPTATLFTLGRNHSVQQYDVTPGKEPMQVASVQHMPAITPPTPPTDLEQHRYRRNDIHTSGATRLPVPIPSPETESSADESGAFEGGPLSPLQKIAKEMDTLDALESEIRDKVMPLSPSSKASSVSSRSSRESRRARRYLYDLPESSRASSTAYNGTEFSLGEPVKAGRESISIRSVSSFASRPTHNRTSSLRKEVMRSPDEATQLAVMDLFPFTKARLREVDFRTPHYGDGPRTAELLQREMLSTIFGWNDDVDSLIHEELARHRGGSASAVLLTKWLGDAGADTMAAMVGSESMTSSDWMLLALNSIGKDSQKKVGEAFVQRLLEKGDIHPAVAILLGLGEYNDAIEVYVSQGFWMEALLLACLQFPADWARQSFLIRKWGEIAVQQGEAMLAVRCFSCAAAETSSVWVSPRAQQEAAFAAQQQRNAEPTSAVSMTSQTSLPSRTGSGRLTAKNASLKLITTFGERAALAAPANQVGTTPIAESAITPGGAWRQPRQRGNRDPSSARTATPGEFVKRKRLPSRGEIERAKQEAAELFTPMTASRDYGMAPLSARPHSRTSNASSLPEPATALRTTTYDAQRLAPTTFEDNRLPSPRSHLVARLRDTSRSGKEPVERKTGGLAVEIVQTMYVDHLSPGPTTSSSRADSVRSPTVDQGRSNALSPSLTDKSSKSKAIDEYISSVEQARSVARDDRTSSRRRGDSRRREESRGGRTSSRAREPSASRGRDNVRYIQPAKRSPASPRPMSPEEIAKAGQQAQADPATTDDEEFYKVASPIASPVERYRSPMIARPESRQARTLDREGSRQRVQAPLVDNGRGRSANRGPGSLERSPSMPLPLSPEKLTTGEVDDTESDGKRFRIRAASANRNIDDLQSRRAASREGRASSTSRRPELGDRMLGMSGIDISRESIAEDQDQSSVSSYTNSSGARRRPMGPSRKELAAKELEDRRLSLARRPSAPQIPHPAELQISAPRPNMAPRSQTELGDSPRSTAPPLSRSQTAEPELMMRPAIGNKSSVMLPPMGLPATPRAMKNPRREGTPPVPDIPSNYSEISSGGSITGSSLSQMTGSNLSQVSSLLPNRSSSITQHSQTSSQSNYAKAPEDHDNLAPLLPSSVFGQKGVPPPRSASVPLESSASNGIHPAYKPGLPSTRRLSVRGHVRKISPPESSIVSVTTASIDETLHNDEQQVIIIGEAVVDSTDPVILPELQHLAGPPPPPPIPTMYQLAGSLTSSDVISIGIDGSSASELSSVLSSNVYPTSSAPPYPHPMERATTASPTTHRRGRGSIGETITTSQTFGSRFKGVTERMRSQSRSRAKSPPMSTGTPQQAPYETVLPPMPNHHGRSESVSRTKSPYDTVAPTFPGPGSHSRAASMSRAKSPYEQAMTAGGQDQQIPPPPPPPMGPPGSESNLSETSIPPSTLPNSRAGSTNGYRNPKEIRANMPPETLQQGVYNGGFL